MKTLSTAKRKIPALFPEHESSRNGSALFRIRSILVPIDFSPESEKALVYAVPFARQFGATLTLIHVLEPVATPDFVDSFPLAIRTEELITSGKSHLERILSDLQINRRLVKNVLVGCGRAFQEIVETAHAQQADLIIMSTHGYTGLKHTLLGSTTERVVRHATCPVLVVRPREREFVTRTRKFSTRECI